MDTIKSSAEISQLFSTGQRIGTPYLTLIVGNRADKSNQGEYERHGQPGRVAFIAGKKLGNAVWRNRAKRRMRAICFQLGGPWSGRDVVFLAKSGICQASYSKVLRACEKAVGRLTGTEEIPA